MNHFEEDLKAGGSHEGVGEADHGVVGVPTAADVDLTDEDHGH